MTERPLRSIQKRRTRGAIYVEVLVAIIPVLVFFFGLLQLAMLYSAKLIVRHAAWRAARSAVVILDDDPKRFNDVERGVITYRETAGSDQAGGGVEQLLEGIADVLDIHLPMTQLRGMASSQAGPRLSAIKQAASMPLAVLAPTPGALMRTFGLSGDEFGSTSNSTRFLIGMFLYNRAAVMVTVRDSEGVVLGGEDNRVPSTDNITVRVTYLYYCGMPIVNYFMCDSLMKMSGLDRLDDAAKTYYESVKDTAVEATRSVDGAQNAQQGIEQANHDLSADLQSVADQVGGLSGELQYAETPELLLPLMFSRAHFKMLSAEATMPNQGACYYPGSTCFAVDRVVEGGDE